MKIDVKKTGLESGLEGVTCLVCGGGNVKLYHSTKNDNGRSRYRCADCGKRFLKKDEYKKKTKLLLTKADFCCPNCASDNVYSSRKMAKDGDRQRYKCYSCNRTFLNPSESKRKKPPVDMKIDFCCPYCKSDEEISFRRRQKKVLRNGDVVVHLIFKCEKCDKTFLDPKVAKRVRN